MKKEAEFKNAIVVLDEPFKFDEEESVYGFIFERKSEKDQKTVLSYVEYVAGMEQLFKYGYPTDDGDGWYFPQAKFNVSCEWHTLASFIGMFLIEKVGYKTYKFHEPLVWEKGEVADYNGTFITSPSLIERYVKQEESKRDMGNSRTENCKVEKGG